jgi:ABC-type uncharacterized transport system permease subunit
MMNSISALDVMALATLTPAAFLGLRQTNGRDRLLWIALLAALLGPALWIGVSFSPGWRTDFGAALWVTATVTVGLFIAIAMFDTDAWRLSPLLAPTVWLIGLAATIWTGHEGARPLGQGPTTLVAVHIVVSVATYGLVTIAAVAALAALMQERSLKTKHPSRLTHALPSVTACDRLMVRLLIAGEGVLAAGLLSGMALRYAETHTLLVVDHKTILTVTAFVLIGGILLVHFRSGLRGRKAARLALAAYLLLTLGYPGVKFVTDVLLS